MFCPTNCELIVLNGSDILKKEAMYIKSLEVFDTICSFNQAERLSKGLNKYFAVGDGTMIIDPDARPETSQRVLSLDGNGNKE